MRICYAESSDGLLWTRPDLGRSACNGNKHNNILLGLEFCTSLDNFVVFKDENPECPPDELFKMLIEYTPTDSQDDKGLWLMTSPNPTDFKLVREIVHRGNWNEAMKNEVFSSTRKARPAGMRTARPITSTRGAITVGRKRTSGTATG